MVVLVQADDEAGQDENFAAILMMKRIATEKKLSMASVDGLVVFVEKWVRMIVLRKRFLRKLRAQCVIAAAARGRHARRQFRRDKQNIVMLQARTRGNQQRKRQKLSLWEKTAKGCIDSYLRCLQDGDHAVLRTICTNDVQVSVDLPAFKHTCVGVSEFLAHPTISKKPPRVSKTHMELTVVPRKQRAGESTAAAATAAASETTFAREVTMGMSDLRQEFTVRRVDLSKGPGKRRAVQHQTAQPGAESKDGVRSMRRERTAAFICAVMTGSRHVHGVNGEDADGDGVPDGDGAHFRVLGLRESFATLDSDASGHLSLGEISEALSLVGLDLPQSSIRRSLNGIHTDSYGGFELTELDSVLRRDKEMQVRVCHVCATVSRCHAVTLCHRVAHDALRPCTRFFASPL